MHVTTCDSPAHTPGLQGNVLVPLATRLRSRGAAGSPDGSCVGGTGLHGCPAKRALELLEHAERCGGGARQQSPAVPPLQPGLESYEKLQALIGPHRSVHAQHLCEHWLSSE